MTKVWVPIELPDGYRVREVIAECDEGGGSVSLRRLEPCDTITVDHPWERHIPEPQRERWEYAAMLQNRHTEGSFTDDMQKMGDDGWELVAAILWTTGNQFWFKRRLS